MDNHPHVQVAIIDSGFAGPAMAIQLKRHGLVDFVVLERADDVGGAWRDNTYPGCPNSALAHNSVLLGIEIQVSYVLDALRVMQSHQLAAVEVQPQAQDAFVRAVQARMAGTVWMTGGCHSWFLDHAGRNTTVWPWPTTRLRRQTRHFDLQNYHTLARDMDACRC